MNVQKSKILTASVIMALAVALGAFGAHGLKPHLSAYGADIFKTANFYHFIHGLALFVWISFAERNKISSMIFYGFLTGILLFSGSLYLLALKEILPFVQSWYGAITPIGGLLFIVSWIAIGITFFSKKDN